MKSVIVDPSVVDELVNEVIDGPAVKKAAMQPFVLNNQLSPFIDRSTMLTVGDDRLLSQDIIPQNDVEMMAYLKAEIDDMRDVDIPKLYKYVRAVVDKFKENLTDDGEKSKMNDVDVKIESMIRGIVRSVIVEDFDDPVRMKKAAKIWKTTGPRSRGEKAVMGDETYDEIAAKLGVSPSTVTNWDRKLRTKFMSHMIDVPNPKPEMDKHQIDIEKSNFIRDMMQDYVERLIKIGEFDRDEIEWLRDEINKEKIELELADDPNFEEWFMRGIHDGMKHGYKNMDSEQFADWVEELGLDDPSGIAPGYPRWDLIPHEKKDILKAKIKELYYDMNRRKEA